MGMMDDRWATDKQMKEIEKEQERILRERQEKAQQNKPEDKK